MKQKRLIGENFKILSGSALKLIALITMFIDHTAVVFLKDASPVIMRIGAHTLTLYKLMRYIGRLSFPIFAFLIIEGFLHTSDRRKYGMRLLIFALISELPWNLEHTGIWHYASQNVFFTLFLGYAGLCVIEYFKNDTKRQAILLILLLIAAVIMRADYGASGFGFIIMLYLLRQNRVYQTVLGCCILPSRWIAGLAFIPINLYNGKRGFIKGGFAKYIFYAVYPAHMLALYFIKARIIGY